MDSALKQRLVGAVVLVALAVIFLPMLLDGSGAEKRLNEQVAIPEKPEQPVSQFDQPIDEAEASGDTQTTASQSADTSSESASTSTSASSSASTSASTPDSSEAESAEPSGSNTETASASQPSEASTQTSDQDTDSTDDAGDSSGDTAAPEQEISEGWVVQVGSFHRQTNALVMRDKLRKADFDADAESVQGENGTLWRVLLGPVAKKEQGQALKQRFEQDQGSEALLRSYP